MAFVADVQNMHFCPILATLCRNEIVEKKISHFDYKYSFDAEPNKVTNYLLERLSTANIEYQNRFVIVRIVVKGEMKGSFGCVLDNILSLKDMFLTRESAETELQRKISEFDERMAYIEKNRVPSDYDFSANGYKNLGYANGGLVQEKEEYKRCISEKHPHMEIKMQYCEHLVYCPTCKTTYMYDSGD